MVRGTEALSRGYRPFLPRSLHHREHPPLRLKNAVAGAGERMSSAYCVPELSVFLACMKRTDFEESECTKEFQSFTACVGHEKARHAAVKEASKAGVLGGSEIKALSRRQANALLAQWPQPHVHDVRSPHILPQQEYHEPLLKARQKRGNRFA